MDEATLGVDTGKTKLELHLLRADGRKRKKGVDNSADGHAHLKDWLAKHADAPVRIVLEATGRYWMDLAMTLHEAGYVVSVVNPARVKHFQRLQLGRGKSDRIDSHVVAQFGRLLRPTAWTPPPAAVLRLRDLVRIREQLVEDLTAHRNQLQAGRLCDAARRADPSTAPARVRRDAWLRTEIRRVWEENFQVYGVRKVWRQLLREGFQVARCTVARLMREMELQGAVRGKGKRTTVSDPARACPLDLVNRNFQPARPNVLWVSDFTYVATWNGFAHVAFVMDAFARRIVGWRASHSAETGFVLDALEQALHARQPVSGGQLVHHSDRGVQYVSIRYTERLAEAGIEPSVGSVGDSYDNALAETVIGLFKTEVIRQRGPWRNLDAVELATLDWVDWFNHRRLLEPLGNIPPAEAEANFFALDDQAAMAA
jgi:transposase InsO family protein